MGVCIYCGKSAGIFRKQHKQCRALHDIAATRIPEFFTEALEKSINPARFRELADEVAATHFVAGTEYRTLVLTGLDQMIDKALEDEVLTDEESHRIVTLADTFGIEGTDEDFELTAKKLKKANILRLLANGEKPAEIRVEGLTGLNVESGEIVVYIFNAVTRFAQQTRTQYVGRSQGVSVRIMRGVYYRVGAFKGEPIKTKETKIDGFGDLIITDRNVFFNDVVGGTGVAKISIRKIAAVQPCPNGIIVTRDTVNPKPITFEFADGPKAPPAPEEAAFAANLITKLNQLN